VPPLLLVLLLLWSAAARLPAMPVPPPAAETVRVAGQAFGAPVEIQVAGLPRPAAETAAAAALAALAAAEELADPEAGPLAVLNAAAGQGPRPVDERLRRLLGRALDFCRWSEQAHGPLGRDLYRLWGLRGPVAGAPAEPDLAAAAASAACDRLRLDAKAGTAALAAGGGLDLWGFAEGEAVDRAVEALKAQGAPAGLVRLGKLWRGFGAPPRRERGWRVSLPVLPGMQEPLEVWLRDQALALVSARERPLRVGGEEHAPYLSQRTGRPAAGALAVAAAAELGVDAQALGVSLLITGPREGQLRMGSLKPRPAVLWALGSGQGEPLLVEYNWPALTRR
jgi:thiamine biosynthesis lipoprotein